VENLNVTHNRHFPILSRNSEFLANIIIKEVICTWRLYIVYQNNTFRGNYLVANQNRIYDLSRGLIFFISILGGC